MSATRQFHLRNLPICIVLVETNALERYILLRSKQRIRELIESRVSSDGLTEIGVKGVQLFRVTEAVRCAPAVYEPTVVAIVSGAKEAILDGTSHVYDSSQYMC